MLRAGGRAREKRKIFFCELGAVYMSPSCRDETLAGLKVERAKFGGKNLFTS